MPKAKNKKTTKKQPKLAAVKHFYKQNTFQFFVIVAVVLVGLFFVGKQAYIFYERQQFKAAEATLDELQAEIIAQLGQPATATKEKSCSYSSAKYSKGDLRCSVSLATYYSDISDKEGPEKLLALTLEKSGINPSNEKATYPDKPAFYFEKNGLYCTLSFEKNGLTETSTSFRIHAGCYKDPVFELYPVDKR